MLFLFTACFPERACEDSQEQPLLILFIGNSYIYTNDLPGMFTKLACSAGQKVVTDAAATGGATLEDHVKSAQTAEKLRAQPWDIVVIQEQSEIPAFKGNRLVFMYPAAKTLVKEVRALGSQPLFFLTWGRRDGEPDFGMSYFDMQAEVDTAYYGLAQELKVNIAQVGDAWLRARSLPEPVDMWQPDGSHPNLKGSYLAACVFYAQIYQKSPEGLEYYAGLSAADAKQLQTIAAETVLK